MEDTAAVAEARVIYRQFLAQRLASTPLAGMADWVATGSPPPAAELISAGFSGDEVPIAEELRQARAVFGRVWGHSIPCREAVTALRSLGPLLEIGAGLGNWSAMLRAAGHDVIATDIAGQAPVLRFTASDAVTAHLDRDVFCIWPSAGEPWIYEALSQVHSGRLIALILDEREGMTGDKALRDFLANACVLLETVEIPRFPGTRDGLAIYRKL